MGIGTAAPAQLLHLFGTAQPNFKLETTGNNHPHLMISGNRTAANVDTGRVQFEWNGNAIAMISSVSGPDTTNKDDGQLSFQTAAAGGILTEAMRIDETQDVAVACTLTVTGAVSKGSGSFRIRHPLESRDGYDLVHSFTESPQADLIYSGWTKLTSGITTINIDTIHDMTEGTFVALNRCIRVFTSNESDWDMVRGSVTGNQLTIESNNSSSVACVSWLVIGERCDKHMFDTGWTDDNGRVIVEPETAPPLVIEE